MFRRESLFVAEKLSVTDVGISAASENGRRQSYGRQKHNSWFGMVGSVYQELGKVDRSKVGNKKGSACKKARDSSDWFLARVIVHK